MSPQAKSLYVAMELSNKNWKLATGDGARERQKTVPARAKRAFLAEIERAKEKFGLPADCRVVCCYEAGRDGFWISRFLEANGLECLVMDPASIEVSRRGRRRKNDRLDASRLLDLLVRKDLMGQDKAFSVVKVPTPEQEDQLRLYRERERLHKERTGHRARIKSLVVLHGVTISDPARMPIERLRDWDGNPLPPALQEELRREQQRLQQVQTQLHEIETRQQEVLADPEARAERILWKLVQLKAVGIQSGWVLAYECFGWRQFRNRKCLGSFVGLTGTPYDSGDSQREQGISKAGNKRVRAAMIELAWGWVRWQPNSALTRWYMERFGNGTKRMRRIGIVALARKLLIALWKYVEQDEFPEGAVFTN